MKYRISNEAKLDLENIWLYTLKEWSIEAADRYIQSISNEIQYLAEHPSSGTDCSDLKHGYFKARVKSHFIFYRINNSTLEVIRILHQRRDIPRHL